MAYRYVGQALGKIAQCVVSRKTANEGNMTHNKGFLAAAVEFHRKLKHMG